MRILVLFLMLVACTPNDQAGVQKFGAALQEVGDNWRSSDPAQERNRILRNALKESGPLTPEEKRAIMINELSRSPMKCKRTIMGDYECF